MKVIIPPRLARGPVSSVFGSSRSNIPSTPFLASPSDRFCITPLSPAAFSSILLSRRIPNGSTHAPNTHTVGSAEATQAGSSLLVQLPSLCLHLYGIVARRTEDAATGEASDEPLRVGKEHLRPGEASSPLPACVERQPRSVRAAAAAALFLKRLCFV